MQAQSTTKWCRRCETDKPQSEFYEARHKGANRDGLQSYCKRCAVAAATEWREKHPERAAAYGKRYRAERPDRYRQYDEDRHLRSPAVRAMIAARDAPCVDCGIRLPPRVMEFDHVRGTKAFSIGGPRIRDKPLEAVLAEIAKCDIRCPNCHRMRHHREREQMKTDRRAALEAEREAHPLREFRKAA